ncbi:GNAT family N-acetyltransferase [Spongiimicrobium sp. 3-5]|uniref:GNAT family N-acetyltransferase n=1 Tax=Spongiimicrobium sp. 3-5 TaxID=3332596 RepID=UPI00397FD4F8
MSHTLIREMSQEDWQAVATIYLEGIATGYATFEQEVPSFDAWDKAHLKKCRMVASIQDTIVGWAALSAVSSRCVYGGVAEVSVYVAQQAWGLGVGKLLMKHLIDESEVCGLWTLQSGIFPENIGSIKLHEKMGFRFIGKRERIGKLNGAWKDNLLFERRSKKIGIS